MSDWLKEENVPGIFGIDTRYLAQILRERGTMLGKIVFENDNHDFYDPNKADLVKKARDVYDKLKTEWACTFDLSGSIGRRYARADETGIYASVTIDFESLEDESVTVRSRDTTEQIRVKIKDLKEILKKFLDGERLGKLGKEVVE